MPASMTSPRRRAGPPPWFATAQAALAFAHEHLAVTRQGEIRVVNPGRVRNGIVHVHLNWPRGALAIEVKVETVAADGLTCHNPGPSRYVTYRPVWIEQLTIA